MIEVREVNVILDDRSVLEDIHFSLSRGEILGLIGPPESGKTTLFKTLAGLIPASSGDVLFDGSSKIALNDQGLHEWQSWIGMSFQNDALFDSLTVFDNVAFPLRRRRVNEETIKSQVFERLEQVGLKEASAKYPSEISGGMRKRVGIARAMIINPPIGLFDDPTAGLDPLTSATILDMVVYLARELNSATIIISNDLPVLFPICDRILMLCEGKVVFDGKVDDILTSPNAAVVQFAIGGDEGPL